MKYLVNAVKKIIADSTHGHPAGKILNGKVRYWDAKRHQGVITGPDGYLYDIELNMFDKKHDELASHIKQNMSI